MKCEGYIRIANHCINLKEMFNLRLENYQLVNLPSGDYLFHMVHNTQLGL